MRISTRSSLASGFLVPRRNLFLQSAFRLRHQHQQHPRRSLQLQPVPCRQPGHRRLHFARARLRYVSTNQNIQLTETAILNSTTINETRFQFSHGRNEQVGNNDVPALDVSGSFGSGGSQVGNSFNVRKSWELNNFTAKQKGSHAIKFGGRIRHSRIDDTNEGNFGGSWAFSGGFGLTSIERYQLTLQMQEQGFTPAANSSGRRRRNFVPSQRRKSVRRC